MVKVVLEILRLFWKLLQKTFWQWLKPLIARVVLFVLLVVALFMIAFVLIAR